MSEKRPHWLPIFLETTTTNTKKNTRRFGRGGCVFPGSGNMESPIISISNGISFLLKSHLACRLLIIRLSINPVTNMRGVFTTKLNRTSVCGTRRRCRSYPFCCSFSLSKQTTSFFQRALSHPRAKIAQACKKLSSDQICVLGRRIPLVDKIGGAPNGVGRWAPIVPLLGRIRLGADLLQERRYHPPWHRSASANPLLRRLGQSASAPSEIYAK